MNIFSVMQNLYLFLVALVITVGLLMIVLFFSLFNREGNNNNSYQNSAADDFDLIQKDKQP